jgi:class 3 adenylate cyclase/tetratricopeptide (TPR) repeat protein
VVPQRTLYSFSDRPRRHAPSIVDLAQGSQLPSGRRLRAIRRRPEGLAMQCPQCQAENPERARFCEDCGARLEFKCPHCGEAATPGKKFCASCGGSLAALPTVACPAPSPQDYTPQHLAERIIGSRGALEGERKQVTILFADLKGSMELLADRDPEEARSILDPVLERMMDAVHRYEGTVNQVMGDGIMALFGAPLAHEDHAVRACYAALRMQERVRQYAEEIRRRDGVTIQIRVGLNSGEVVVRSIGSDLRIDYTAVGQTTHLAARMEQLALAGSILLAPDTLRLVEGYVQVKGLGPMQVKGLADPVEVYELTGAGTTRTRLQAAAARGLTKFVGRDTEIATLRRTLEQAGQGHGQLVALVGEPGVGKSRLTWEFTHSHRVQGWLVLESGSVSYGKATSYLPVIDLLKTYCGVEARDEPRRIRAKVLGRLLTLDRALEAILPSLLALLDLPVDDPSWAALDPPQRRSRTLDALKRLLLREAQEQPLLLVFEDLHWIDAETQALLDLLVEGLPTARILLLVNYRAEYDHSWHRKSYYQQLRLDPLPAESADELLAALLGQGVELAALKRLLIERTQGNPFFIEESVRALVESRALVGKRGSYRLVRPLESTQVPATVQAVLAARIDRLDPADKRLLQSASVIGKDIPYRLLRAIAGNGLGNGHHQHGGSASAADDRLQASVARLQTAEFLYETSLFPDREYMFKHALTHEVAYGSLLQEQRRALHARIVGAIETSYPDRLAEQVERLAYHAFRGEVWDQAVIYLRQAGAKASSRSAYREAVAYYEQALAGLAHLPDTPAAREQAFDIREELRPCLVALGEFGRVIEHLQAAERLAEALDDQRRLARAVSFLADYYWNVGENEGAIAAGERALSIAVAQGDRANKIVTCHRLGRAYSSVGNYPRAIEVFRQAADAVPADLIGEHFGMPTLPVVGALAWEAVCLAESGELSAALERASEAFRLAERLDRAFGRVATHWTLGHVYLRRGQMDRAIDVLERGLELGQAGEVLYLAALVASPLGQAYTLAGQPEAAVRLLEGVIQRTTFKSIRLAYLAAAYQGTGRVGDAWETAQRALELARQQKERGHEAWALQVLGEIAAHDTPPRAAEAETHYRQALALAEELGMRPLVAHCHLGLGTLYQRLGRDEQRQSELTTAAEMYRAMEMTFWLEKAEATLAQVAR